MRRGKTSSGRPLIVCPTMVRRLAIVKQHLSGERSAGRAGIMNVMRDIGYLQIDPMRIVERSHLLVLWSRLGRYSVRDFEELLWSDRLLFEDWAQASSIVSMEDYPIFAALKRGYGRGASAYAKKVRAWMEMNKDACRGILSQLRREGPLSSHSFDVRFAEEWRSGGWTSGRSVDMMLTFLWAQGKVMIAGRRHGRRVWDLTERFLPDWASRKRLSDLEVYRLIAQKSLRALGVGRPADVERHFIRGCCPEAGKVLAGLEAEGLVYKVRVVENEKPWPGEWYVHCEDLPLVESLTSDDWLPRTTLLSPFDNLISDRARTESLFGFRFRLEVYVPKSKRKHGCYVMPILHGDRLVGRVDPVMDRKRKRLMINSVYAEPDAPKSRDVADALALAVKDLAAFLGAEQIDYGQTKPAEWAGYPR
jgi:uncharacterized protein YcaQ